MSSNTSGDDASAASHNTAVGAIAKIIHLARNNAKLTQQRLGELTGVSRAAVSQWESGETTPDRDRLAIIARVLALDAGMLLRSLDDEKNSQDAHNPVIERNKIATSVTPLDRANPPPHRDEMPKDVPVLGTVVGGAAGDFQMNGEHVEFVRRPPRLMGRRDVFSVYVQGSSMEPRFFSGELLYLEANRPPHNGDFIVVEMRPVDADPVHPAYLKRLVGVTPTKIRLQQYNPADVLEIDRRRVLKVYRVMTTMDLLGV